MDLTFPGQRAYNDPVNKKRHEPPPTENNFGEPGRSQDDCGHLPTWRRNGVPAPHSSRSRARVKFTNRHNLPGPLAAALRISDYIKIGDYSITELIGPPRARILRLRHDEDIEIDVATRVWALLGTAVHWIIQRGAEFIPDGFAEERLIAKVRGPRGIVRISGATDWLESAEGQLVLSDYKCSAVFAFLLAATTGYVKKEWEAQLNCYRWLWAKYGFKISRLQIVGIIRDWKKGELKRATARGDYYPTSPVIVPEVRIWSLAEAGRYIKERVRIHEDAATLSDADLPICTPEERWERFENWSIFKTGTKRAINGGVKDTEAAALELLIEKGAGYVVRHRPGECNRCDPDYCPGAPWCSFYKNLLSASNLEE